MEKIFQTATAIRQSAIRPIIQATFQDERGKQPKLLASGALFNATHIRISLKWLLPSRAIFRFTGHLFGHGGQNLFQGERCVAAHGPADFTTSKGKMHLHATLCRDLPKYYQTFYRINGRGIQGRFSWFAKLKWYFEEEFPNCDGNWQSVIKAVFKMKEASSGVLLASGVILGTPSPRPIPSAAWSASTSTWGRWAKT